MFVCICRAVTDRQLDAAIAGGACSLRDLGQATGAGTGCGSCRRVLARRLGQVAPDSAGASPACTTNAAADAARDAA